MPHIPVHGYLHVTCVLSAPVSCVFYVNETSCLVFISSLLILYHAQLFSTDVKHINKKSKKERKGREENNPKET